MASSDTQCLSMTDQSLTPSDRPLAHSCHDWPAWLFLLAGLFVFSPLLEGGTTHLAVMVIRLLILLLLGIYVMNGVRTGALTLMPFPVGPAVLAYLLLAVLSTIRSPYTHQSVQWLIVLLSYAVLLYLLVSWL
ncbi:MAG: hypothetical protein FJ246_03155, partial [Nitrospira sp.]|nr:hypothetical protein [Nitrospira sp.]